MGREDFKPEADVFRSAVVPWWAPEAVEMRMAVCRVEAAYRDPHGDGRLVPGMERALRIAGVVLPTWRQDASVASFKRAVVRLSEARDLWNGGRP